MEPVNVYAFFVQPAASVPPPAERTPEWFFQSKAPSGSIQGVESDADGLLERRSWGSGRGLQGCGRGRSSHWQAARRGAAGVTATVTGGLVGSAGVAIGASVTAGAGGAGGTSASTLALRSSDLP